MYLNNLNFPNNVCSFKKNILGLGVMICVCHPITQEMEAEFKFKVTWADSEPISKHK